MAIAVERYEPRPASRGPSGNYGVWDVVRGKWVTAQNMWDGLAANIAGKLNDGWHHPVSPPKPVMVWRSGGWWPAYLCRWQKRKNHRGEMVWWGQAALEATGEIGWYEQHNMRPAIDQYGTNPAEYEMRGMPPR